MSIFKHYSFKTLSMAFLVTLLSGFLTMTYAQSQWGQRGGVDAIAAIVNDEVITMRAVEREVAGVKKEFRSQNIPLPDDETLQKQVLQRLITEKLIEQQAQNFGIQVTDADVQRAVDLIAANNNLDEAGLRKEIHAAGIAWEDYLHSLRYDILLDQLRFRTVDEMITISESEVDAYLARHGYGSRGADSASAAPQEGDELVELAQIVIRVPENSSLGQERELQAKAQSILEQLRAGHDFATLAASFSDGDEALSGGHLGTRPLEGWPDVFVAAIKDLQPGEISGLVRSGQGFHIFKVTNRGVPAPVARQRPPSQASDSAYGAPMMVTQTHARHILIKLSQVMDDDKARERLEQLRQRVLYGEDFADLARSYSEDASAPQGGDLGWLSPGETVPAFEHAMNALAINEVSAPIRSPFGWHLIQVLDRREKDMSEELRRLEARMRLYEQYAEPAFEDWLAQVRGQAYIENRLDPTDNRRAPSRRR